MPAFYLGSCRYMYCNWSAFFPARLHSSAEMLHFLEHLDAIEEFARGFPADLASCVFGDLVSCAKFVGLISP